MYNGDVSLERLGENWTFILPSYSQNDHALNPSDYDGESGLQVFGDEGEDVLNEIRADVLGEIELDILGEVGADGADVLGELGVV